MSVIGSISIKDNATAVFRNLKKEQSSFRDEVKKTKKELKDTWDKKYQAKLDATPASKAMQKLKSQMEPLRKKVVKTVAVKDLATEQLKKTNAGLKNFSGKVFSPIVKVRDLTAGGLSKISGALKSIGKTVAIPVMIGAITIAGGAISEGAKLEQSIGGVETLFGGEAASIVKNNASAAFKTAGLSANDYMSQVTSISASLISSLSGDTVKAAMAADMAMTDMSDNANKFGTDMESIQNAYQGFAKQNYTMLDNLKLGYGGTKEEMQRLLKDAEAITGVKYNINNLSDVYNAIHAIQSEMGVSGATKAEAEKTFSGSFAAMKAAAKNVLGNMATGGDVEGSMAQLVESAGTFLIGNAVPMIGRVIASLPGAISTGVKTALPQIRQSGKEILTEMMAGISEESPLLGNIFSGIGDKISGAVSFISSKTGFLQSVLEKSLPAIGEVVSTAWNVISPVMDIMMSTYEILFRVVERVFPGIQSVVETVWKAVEPLIDGVGSVVGGIADWLGSVADTINGTNDSKTKVGRNAKGSNNWRGGLTWVGEKGPELLNLPGGSKILPNKESISLLKSDRRSGNITVTIAKLADQIVIREEADIDRITDKVAQKVVEVAVNMS